VTGREVVESQEPPAPFGAGLGDQDVEPTEPRTSHRVTLRPGTDIGSPAWVVPQAT